LSQFSRRATWLNILFPASVAPQTRDPGQRSDDVSLVQPYDGGGFGFAHSDHLVVTTGALTAAAVAEGATILTIGPEEIYRIMGAMVTNLDVTTLQMNFLSVIDRGGTGDQMFLADPIQFNAGGFNPGESRPFNIYNARVLGPDMTVRYDNQVGEVGKQTSYAVFGYLAPVGTAFSV